MEQSTQTEKIYRVTIYVAGPYSHGDIDKNVKKALDTCNKLINIGAATFCPHTFHYLNQRQSRTWDEWMQLCLKWVSVCDAFYRIKGYSPGSDKETAMAFDLGKPIFKSIDEVKKWLLP